MPIRKVVAYYRVSTERQGKSGLGLDAQRKAVADYLNGQPIIAEFTEVESGKSDKNRPQLITALDLCRKRKATLVIAKLDRLSRNAGFLLTLRDGNVDVRACDMPDAGTLEFGIRAVVAQHEREETSRRTVAALAAARARGQVLGANGKRLARKNRQAALEHARSIAKEVRRILATHTTLRDVASAMNAAGVPTNGGGAWHPTSVNRLLKRMAAL